jgi:tetratricopeptide (TPR) repeat protein
MLGRLQIGDRCPRQVAGQLMLTCLFCLILATVAFSQENFLEFRVIDVAGHPLSGVTLSLKADGATSAPTDQTGKTRITLSSSFRPGSKVALQIVQTPEDMIMVLPWDDRVVVPVVRNASQGIVSIVLGRRGDRTLLEKTDVQMALMSKIIRELTPKPDNDVATEKQRQEALNRISEAYGLQPEEVDRSIREWGAKTSNPYEKGLVALYENKYSDADRLFSTSIKTQEPGLELVKAGLVKATVDRGKSLYKQGIYEEAIACYQQALALSPNDVIVLNELGMLYSDQDRFGEAESAYKQAIIISEKLNPSSLTLAVALNNLSILYIQKELSAQAEPLLARSSAILKKATEPDSVELAKTLETLADIYHATGHDADAAPFYEQMATIKEKIFGTDQPEMKEPIHRLGEFYRARGDYVRAEFWYQRALTLTEKTAGPESPSVAASLDDLAHVYQAQGDTGKAKSLSQRALAIRENTLDSGHPAIAKSLEHLAVLNDQRNDDKEVEPLFLRSLIIRKNALGENDLSVPNTQKKYAAWLRKMKRGTEAAEMEKQANAFLIKKYIQAPITNVENRTSLTFNIFIGELENLGLNNRIMDNQRPFGALPEIAFNYELQMRVDDDFHSDLMRSIFIEKPRVKPFHEASSHRLDYGLDFNEHNHMLSAGFIEKIARVGLQLVDPVWGSNELRISAYYGQPVIILETGRNHWLQVWGGQGFSLPKSRPRFLTFDPSILGTDLTPRLGFQYSVGGINVVYRSGYGLYTSSVGSFFAESPFRRDVIFSGARNRVIEELSGIPYPWFTPISICRLCFKEVELNNINQYLSSRTHHAWDDTYMGYVLYPMPAQFAAVKSLNPANSSGNVADSFDLSGFRRSIQQTGRNFSGDVFLGLFISSLEWVSNEKNGKRSRLPFSDFMPASKLGIWKLAPDRQTFDLYPPDLPAVLSPRVKAIGWLIIPR